MLAFPAGSTPVVVSSNVADKLATLWGKAVIVENITGASGNIATDRAAKAAPDGYTLFMGGNSSLIMSVSLFDKLTFDPVKDFIPITQVFVAANLLVVHPDLPTMIEMGYPDFEAVPWFGFLAPTGTPSAIVEKIYRDTVAVLAMPDVRKRFEDNGLDVIGSTPAEFANVIKTEIPYWAKIIK